MFSSMQNKNKNKPNPQPVKKQRPRPEWTTDFVDRQQFKLSEVQRIQKKASLQSKNRQEARRQLEERRKKLEMGIIDEQTRKIYETALISKKIDINPPVRKNLTEMIRYEKQQKQKMFNNDEQCNGSENQEELDEIEQSMKQLKEAQNFIKKFERAKKQQKIQRAVQILSNNKSLQKQKKLAQSKEPQKKFNNFFIASNEDNSRSNKGSTFDQKTSNKSQSLSQNDALSSIQDTIRFMEEKLFAAKKTVDEHSKSFISEANQSFVSQKSTGLRFDQKETTMCNQYNFKKGKKTSDQVEINFQTKGNFGMQEELDFGDKIGQISQLNIRPKGQQDGSSDDQCLDTIRRMRELMEEKDNEYQNYQNYENKKISLNVKENPSPSVGSLGFNSTISKRSFQSVMDSQAEVSFNLTMNNQDEEQHDSSIFNISKSKFRPFQQGLSSKQSLVDFEAKNQQKRGIKKNKQDDYEEEYKKIKQNLFSCLNSNIEEQQKGKTKNHESLENKKSFSKFDENEEEDSQDSLMVRDKINMWKKEMQHQKELDSEGQDENVQLKTTTFTKKPQVSQARALVKQQQESESEQDDEPYRHNYFSQQRNQNTNSLNSYQQQNPAKQRANQELKTAAMKKPPLVKKSQNNEKYEEMKKMISNASSEIGKIQIQPLKIQPLGGGEVLGFDFRGSINIKKNILSK